MICQQNKDSFNDIHYASYHTMELITPWIEMYPSICTPKRLWIIQIKSSGCGDLSDVDQGH